MRAGERPEWDDYFLRIAEVVASRADCRRRRYGAVIVRDHRIVSTGYNGAPAGAPGCLAGACPRGLASEDDVRPFTSYDTGPGACIAVHAEANALLYADYEKLRGATLYLWGDKEFKHPCDGCLKLIRACGVNVISKG